MCPKSNRCWRAWPSFPFRSNATITRRSPPATRVSSIGRTSTPSTAKNLFLRNQKGTRHYLVILSVARRADLRVVAEQIGDGKLSFASAERLKTHLGVTPGSVSPFGLIHDREHHVRVFLDRELRLAERISFHPNINTRTVVLAFSDFEKYLATTWNVVRFVEMTREGQGPSRQA
ncbi:MAG TPA: YbaK/EbsC family protein [Vicinamibacterales bacterium]|nr:YbaK/EbsC family protein [Vicinamibacterales bacterium]